MKINIDTWASFDNYTNRPCPKSGTCGIAVEVINHLGDEVMKVFRVN